MAIKSFGTWSSPNWMVYILWHQQYFKKSKALAHHIIITYRYWSKVDVWSAIKVMRERERERERERMFKRIKGKWICTNLLMIRALFLLMVVSWQYIWLVEAISYFLKKTWLQRRISPLKHCEYRLRATYKVKRNAVKMR